MERLEHEAVAAERDQGLGLGLRRQSRSAARSNCPAAFATSVGEDSSPTPRPARSITPPGRCDAASAVTYSPRIASRRAHNRAGTRKITVPFRAARARPLSAAAQTRKSPSMNFEADQAANDRRAAGRDARPGAGGGDRNRAPSTCCSSRGSRLRSGEVVGAEALVRSAIEPTRPILFHRARRAGLGEALSKLAQPKALREAAHWAARSRGWGCRSTSCRPRSRARA